MISFDTNFALPVHHSWRICRLRTAFDGTLGPAPQSSVLIHPPLEAAPRLKLLLAGPRIGTDGVGVRRGGRESGRGLAALQDASALPEVLRRSARFREPGSTFFGSSCTTACFSVPVVLFQTVGRSRRSGNWDRDPLQHVGKRHLPCEHPPRHTRASECHPIPASIRSRRCGRRLRGHPDSGGGKSLPWRQRCPRETRPGFVEAGPKTPSGTR